MTEQIDVNQLADALNAKVDLDGSWSFPSGTYDNLTLGSDGTTYTAPADGYFTWQKTTNGTNQYFGMVNDTSALVQSIQWVPISGGGCHGFIPAKKGDVCRVGYSAGGTTNCFRFVYTQKTN